MPKEIVEALKPEYVAPLVLFLSHDSCPVNGGLIDVGAGYVGVNRWQRTKGVVLRPDEITPENIAARWGQISDFSTSTNPTSSEEIMQVVMQNIENKAHSASSAPAAKKDSAPVAKTTTPPPAASTASTGAALKADDIFNMMASFLDQGHGKPLIPKVDAVFEFEIVRAKGGKVEGTYTIDLKNGQGQVTKGKAPKADAVFNMTDDDFEAVCQGKLNPQIAFMQGKMKIKGNMAKATKFTPDLFPPPTEENKAKFKSAKL